MTAPDVTEALRRHRRDLGQRMHGHLDTIETAAAQGKNTEVCDTVDQLHALVDLLADIVPEPDLAEIAGKLDQHAADLAENNEYDGARLVIETAEAFGRRHAQLVAAYAATPAPVTESHAHYHVGDASEALQREERRRAKQDLQYMRR